MRSHLSHQRPTQRSGLNHQGLTIPTQLCENQGEMSEMSHGEGVIVDLRVEGGCVGACDEINDEGDGEINDEGDGEINDEIKDEINDEGELVWCVVII